MSALSEARAHLAELEAQRMNLEAEVKAAADRLAPAKAKQDANYKRRSKVTIATFLAGQHGRGSMASINVDRYSIGTLANSSAKQVAEAIASGNVKVAAGSGGVPYSARGLVKRVVYPLPQDMRAWDRATAARKRAEEALRKAREAELAVAKAAFEGGGPITFDDLVKSLATTAVVDLAVEASRDRTGNRHQLERLTVEDDWGPMHRAKRHVNHLAKKVEDETCPICAANAKEASEREARITAIKALPKRKFTCPTHGRVVGHSGRSQRPQSLKNPDTGEVRTINDAPMLWCPRDWVTYIDARLLAEDDAKAVKEAARAAKAPKRIKTAKPPEIETVPDDEVERVTFICPNEDCEADVEADIIDGRVTCDECGAEYGINDIESVRAA